MTSRAEYRALVMRRQDSSREPMVSQDNTMVRQDSTMSSTSEGAIRIYFEDQDETLELIEDRAPGRTRSGDFEDFKENSTLKLLTSLEVVGSRNARRLSQGIRRHSVVPPVQGVPRGSLRKKSLQGSRNGSIIGTILEIPSTEKGVDAVLNDINPLGRFHHILLLLLFCGAAPIIGFQNFVLETQSIIPPWKCLTDSCTNLTAGYNYTPYDSEEVLCGLERSEWDWDNLLYNAVSQWDIACSPARKILETVFYVPGGLLGSLIVSRICDKMGRRLSFLVSLISCLTVGTMISSSQFFEAYVTFRLILGSSLICIHIINYLWLLEHFSYRSRPFANVAYDFVSLSCVPLLAVLHSCVRSWNYLHLASTISLLTGVLVFFAVPESPRWLLQKGNVEGAENVLKTIARRNHEQYPLRVVLKYHPLDKTSDRRSYKGQGLKYGVMVSLWTSVHLAFIFTKSKIVHFTNNINICEAVYAVSGLPLILLFGLYVCNRLGRRFSLIILLTLTFIFSVLIPVPLPPTPSLILPVIVISGLYPALISTLTLWVVELLPTCHRVPVFSLCVAVKCGIVGLASFLAPLINHRYQYTTVILALLLLLLSLLLSLLLPETKAREMLEVPEREEKHTRGLTLIKSTVSLLSLSIRSSNVDNVKDQADQGPDQNGNNRNKKERGPENGDLRKQPSSILF